MTGNREVAVPLRRALRQAAEDRTYGLMRVDVVDGPVDLVLCDGRIITKADDGSTIDPVALVADLLDADEPDCTVAPLRGRPEIHLAPSADISQVMQQAVRQMTARASIAADTSADGRGDNAADATDDTEEQRRAEADRLRQEFFARRSSPLGTRRGFPASAPETPAPRSQTMHRPPSSNHLTSTLRNQQTTERVAAAISAIAESPAPASVPTAVVDNVPVPAAEAAPSPSTDSPPASSRPTRKLALRSLIRSLIE